MKKQDYLENETVKSFIDWLIPMISGEREFLHGYEKGRSKTPWKCYSIQNAFENYNWRFSCTIPELEKRSGHSFAESQEVLGIIEKGMKSAIENNNPQSLLKYSTAILEWGGVKRSNYPKLVAKGDEIVQYYEDTIKRLNPETVDTEDDFGDLWMNSGFTKIYSLLIDNFVIYDSRVGAALGLLVRKYLEEENISQIPEGLNFAYGNARPTKNDKGPLNRRNPSSDKHKFPQLNNNPKTHIINNIHANWLINELSKRSVFKNESHPMRALESALFMIGYSVIE
ncbi:MAG: hypothetical protein H6581_29375 [Bacteroidia bacterium]|nr:hypothetical protein [Bacteroidia bacterium]